MGDELRVTASELVVGIGGDMMEFIDRNQPIVKGLDAECFDREAEGRVRADEHLVCASEKRAERIDLAAVVAPRRIAQVPSRRDFPIRPEAILT